MDGKQKQDKIDKKNEKLPADRISKVADKRLVQQHLSLNLQSAPPSVKSSLVSDKRPSKQQRTSSSDTEPSTPTLGTDMSNELKLIHASLTEIRESMVKNADIKDIVTKIVSEIKSEIKKEIVEEVKATLKQELTEGVTVQVKTEFENKIDSKTKEFESHTKDIADGVNMDLTALREKFHDQLKELRTLKDSLKRYQAMTETALTLANNNQQYSQKNNIKFLGWKEQRQENLREDLCSIMREAAGVTIDPSDILEIHRIPGAQGKTRPVIAKFRNLEVKVKIIKNRSKEEVKKRFLMFDHITQMNSELLRELKNDDRIQSAWYYNGKIFGLDQKGDRHKFDILDTVGRKF